MRLLKTLCVFALLGCVTLAGAQEPAQRARPNIIFIMADDK